MDRPYDPTFILEYDVWSLGVVILQLLFHGNDIRISELSRVYAQAILFSLLGNLLNQRKAPLTRQTPLLALLELPFYFIFNYFEWKT